MDRFRPPSTRWLRAFIDAEMVVTDSFHRCVFSIIFHKTFIVIVNHKRGYSRFQFLMQMLGLTKSLISNISEYDSTQNHAIPPETYEIINRMKEESLQFLNDVLKNE